MTDVEAMLVDCDKRYPKLNDWEKGFIESLLRMDDLGNLSHSQYEKLEAIWERIT